MTDRQKEIIEAIKTMGVFRTRYKNSEVESVVAKAIKALEQEPIIDKIRERIELEKLGYPPSAGYYKAIMKCLKIIEKYKAESEV